MSTILRRGIDLSVRDLLAVPLAGIEETVLLYPTGTKGRPRAQRILTDTNPGPEPAVRQTHTAGVWVLTPQTT